MPVSTEGAICPYCNLRNAKSKVIGSSGLVCVSGVESLVECHRCGGEFECFAEVKIKYRTRKSD